ncbi:MAG: ABC transporter ATP-binding protein [Patulibacter sp.]
MSTATLTGVSKRYGGQAVLDGVSCEFAPATRYVVRGSSGSGKSTLLNLLAGYLEPDAGSVERPASIGYLFQDELLFGNLTARENLMVRLAALKAPRETWQPRLLEALDRVQLAEKADEVAAMLSGGERQRVELAGLLLAEPQLVLMDEPTSRLDAENQRSVAQAVDQLFGAVTVVVVTHAEHTPLAQGACALRLEGGQLVLA